MIEFLPKETQIQVLKNQLYLDNVERVYISDRNKLFHFIMKTGKLPKITATGYILYKVVEII